MKALQTVTTKLVRLGHQLPEGIGLLTMNGKPLFTITGPNTQEIVGYVCYLQKQGTTSVRPPLTSVAGKDDEIMELGEGWLLMRIVIAIDELANPYRVMARIHAAIPRLQQAQPKPPLEEPTCIVSSAS